MYNLIIDALPPSITLSDKESLYLWHLVVNGAGDVDVDELADNYVYLGGAEELGAYLSVDGNSLAKLTAERSEFEQDGFNAAIHTDKDTLNYFAANPDKIALISDQDKAEQITLALSYIRYHVASGQSGAGVIDTIVQGIKLQSGASLTGKGIVEGGVGALGSGALTMADAATKTVLPVAPDQTVTIILNAASGALGGPDDLHNPFGAAQTLAGAASRSAGEILTTVIPAKGITTAAKAIKGGKAAGEAAEASGAASKNALAQQGKSTTNNLTERITVRTNSAGETVVSIHGREMSIHASGQATTRGISNDSIADAMDQRPFQYIQNGRTQNGYYDASTNTFVGVGDRITTVIRPRNPENYLNNLRNRQ